MTAKKRLSPTQKYHELITIYQGWVERTGNLFGIQHAKKYRYDLRRLFQSLGVRDVLDYGGGATEWSQKAVPEGGDLKSFLNLTNVTNFEPARNSIVPEVRDAVVCFDVLEHVFVADIAYVLDDIFRHADKLVYLVVACYPAKKKLPNGENAHITLRSASWWRGALEMISAQYPDVSYRLIATQNQKPPIVFQLSSANQVIAQKGFERVEILETGNVFKSDNEIVSLLLEKIKSGRGGDAANLLSWVDPSMLASDQLTRYVELSAVLGATGYGDANLLRRNNALIPPDQNAIIRYRSALNTRDWRQAKKQRRHAEAQDLEGDNSVRWAASVTALHRGKKRSGFKFYHHRTSAKHGVRSWPHNAKHVVFDGEIRTPHIHLEQGVGDIILHLAHLKSTGLFRNLIFHCTPRWKPFITKFFPNCTTQVHKDWVIVPNGLEMHASADFLVHQFLKTGTLTPTTLLAPPDPNRDGFGLSWRGGGTSLNDTDRRSIDLKFLLGNLPVGPKFFCLQYDITAEELAIIKRLRPDIAFPKANMKSDIFGLFDLIRSLKGVISVRNTTLHMAGNAGVDALCFIDETTSWLWADDGKTPRALYKKSEILPRKQFSSDILNKWIGVRSKL